MESCSRVCPECRRRWYWPPRYGKPQGGVDAGVSAGGSHDFCEDCLDRMELDQATPEERRDFDDFMMIS